MPDLLTIYQTLLNHYGPQHWWPADSPFEVIVGAYLTQNTNWNNVEKAIVNLKQERALSYQAILTLTNQELEQLIRPAGFFRQKAERLKFFSQHLEQTYQGNLSKLCNQDTTSLRSELLSLKGIGPETADSILLYAGNHLSFVVDAYTRRTFSRIGILTGTESYEQIRSTFMTALPADKQLYNEYHALIVNHCKSHCTKSPKCLDCPCFHICCYPDKRLS